MGNYRFKLSDMMPNAWFYKLRDMSKARNQSPSNSFKKKKSALAQNQKKPSYNHSATESYVVSDRLYTSPNNTKAFDTHFPHDPHRRSSSSCKRRAKRKTIYMPSPRQRTINFTQRPSGKSDDGCIFSDNADDIVPVWLRPGTTMFRAEGPTFQSEESDGYDSFDSFCKLSSSADTDIIIDVDEISYSSIHVDRSASAELFDMTSEPDLPPILTKPQKQNSSPKKSGRIPTENHSIEPKKTSARKSVSRAGGVRIRGNGAKLASKKSRKSSAKLSEKNKGSLFYSDSFAIVKASFDPEKDFRESMMEMIVENNIRASKDLEELLACYLSLNSNQYHDLIIKAFEQIWFNMPQLHV